MASDFMKVLSVAKTGLERGLQGARAGLETAAQVLAEEAPVILGGSKALRDYKLGPPVATCGPGDVWAIYSATSKKPGAVQRDVSVWVLDKKRLQEANKHAARPHCFEQLFNQQKKSCQHMTRLKHPGVVKVIEPLEDVSHQMILVTEPILGSLRNVLTHFSAIPGASEEARAMHMSPLELKEGLMHVTDTLAFLHGEARLVHGGLSPSVLMITAEGVWKLAGFAFAVPSDPSAQQGSGVPFIYSDAFPPMWEELAKPLLPYTAPELVGGSAGSQPMSGSSGGGAVSGSADVFSLAAIVYELLSEGTQLVPVRNNVNEHRAKVAALGAASHSAGFLGAAQDPLSSMPTSLQGVLRSMLSVTPAARPPVTALTATAYFQEDVLLRALRFLDTILQREHTQKLAFVKDLAQFWTQFDDRVLQLRVLPPLVQELRSEAMQPALLPLVLRMLERETPAHFNTVLLPVLAPILETAQGELLGVLLGGSGLLSQLMTQAAASRYLIPLYARALDNSSAPPVQETCLCMLQAAVNALDFSLLKQQILPRCYAVCMHTTAAPVRVHAFGLMTKSVPRLDKEEAGAMLDTAAQVVSVDRSAPTLMCVVALVEAVSCQHGVELTAARVLPLITTLLLCPSLSHKEFTTLYNAVQAMLQRIHNHVSGGTRSDASAATQGSTQPTSSTGASHTAVASWDVPLEPVSHKHRHAGTSGISTSQQAAASSAASWMGPLPTPAPAPASHASTSNSAWAAPLIPAAPAITGAATTSANGGGLGGWGMGTASSGPGLSNGVHAPAASAAMGVGSSSMLPAAPGLASKVPDAMADLFGGLAVNDNSSAGGGGATASSSFAMQQPLNSSHAGTSLHGMSGSHLIGGNGWAPTFQASPQGPSQGGGAGMGLPHQPGLSMTSMRSGALGGAMGLGAPSRGRAAGAADVTTQQMHRPSGLTSVGSKPLGSAPSGDPFSTLTAIALAAPAVQHPQQPPSHAGRTSHAADPFGSWSGVPTIPPPPKAASSVHPAGAGPAAGSSKGADLLLF